MPIFPLTPQLLSGLLGCGRDRSFIQDLDKFYIDFIGLLKEDGQWLIVNKMYCDMAAQQ